MTTIAVVGVTGAIGSRVARKLEAAGYDILGLSRNPGPEAPGRAVAVDLRNGEAATRALADAEAVYLTPPEGGPNPLADELTVGRNVIGAAVASGVGHVIMHTAVRADRGDTGARLLDNKATLERELAGSGVPYSILRPAWYLQNLFMARPYLDQGMFSMPWPEDMVWAATDVDDVAAAAVALFETGPSHRGYDVHLPGGITAGAICSAIEAATGRPIAYQEFPGGPRAAVEGYPISDAHKEIYAELFDYFLSETYLGEPLAITRAIPGFQYGSVEDFVRRELYAEQAAVSSSNTGDR